MCSLYGTFRIPCIDFTKIREIKKVNFYIFSASPLEGESLILEPRGKGIHNQDDKNCGFQSHCNLEMNNKAFLIAGNQKPVGPSV
jgi:hypothetical protein